MNVEISPKLLYWKHPMLLYKETLQLFQKHTFFRMLLTHIGFQAQSKDFEMSSYPS